MLLTRSKLFIQEPLIMKLRISADAITRAPDVELWYDSTNSSTLCSVLWMNLFSGPPLVIIQQYWDIKRTTTTFYKHVGLDPFLLL